MAKGDIEVPTFLDTPEEAMWELRSNQASLWTGSRLLIGMLAFAFGALGFAYFYLKSTNSQGLWRPAGMTAPTYLGGAIMVCAVGGALINMVGTFRLRRKMTLDWIVAIAVVLLAGIVGFGLQIYELTKLPFFPGAAGYSSCFIGWAAMNIALLLSGVYWTETLLARYLRVGRSLVATPEPGADLDPDALHFKGNVEAATTYWGFIALINLVFWLLFYMV